MVKTNITIVFFAIKSNKYTQKSITNNAVFVGSLVITMVVFIESIDYENDPIIVTQVKSVGTIFFLCGGAFSFVDLWCYTVFLLFWRILYPWWSKIRKRDTRNPPWIICRLFWMKWTHYSLCVYMTKNRSSAVSHSLITMKYW